MNKVTTIAYIYQQCENKISRGNCEFLSFFRLIIKINYAYNVILVTQTGALLFLFFCTNRNSLTESYTKIGCISTNTFFKIILKDFILFYGCTLNNKEPFYVTSTDDKIPIFPNSFFFSE